MTVAPKQPDRLTIFALYVMEDLLADARKHVGPMKRTWAVRLAMAYLNQRGLLTKEVAAAIWRDLVDPGSDGNPEAIQAYCRYRDLNSNIEEMFKRAGIYRGPPGRREIGDVPGLRQLIRKPPGTEPYVEPPPKHPWEPERPKTLEEWHALNDAAKASRERQVIRTTHPRHKRKKSTTVGDGSR